MTVFFLNPSLNVATLETRYVDDLASLGLDAWGV